MFHDGDLGNGIRLAVVQAKAVLCFVYDDTGVSGEWEDILRRKYDQNSLHDHVIALRLKAASQEAGFLNGICPIRVAPAIIVIRNAQIQANIQSDETQATDLEKQIDTIFGHGQPIPTASTTEAHDAFPTASPAQADIGQTIPTDEAPSSQDNLTMSNRYIDLPPSSGRMRLSNNAYDALRNQTETMLNGAISPNEILKTQLGMLNRIPTFRKDVERLQNEASSSELKLSDETVERLLRMPAAVMKIPAQYRPSGSGRVYSPPNTSTGGSAERPESSNLLMLDGEDEDKPTEAITESNNEIQRANLADYVKIQKEREQKQREERERIKAQIKADREERRLREDMRKQGEKAILQQTSIADTKPKSDEIRIQVRTFDGSTIRQSFPPSSTLAKDVRSWIDSSTQSTAPYNLKLILTPLPNRGVEAAEEEQSLADFGIKGSATFVMVPVKGYVESYTGSTPGSLVGSAVSGGYSLITGTAGALLGGVRSILGYGQQPSTANPSTNQDSNTATNAGQQGVRVRTLADQRAESRKDQQFYNGNQLNFEPNKDDDSTRKND